MIYRKLNADEWTVNPALESEALSALSAAKNALKNGNTRKVDQLKNNKPKTINSFQV